MIKFFWLLCPKLTQSILSTRIARRVAHRERRGGATESGRGVPQYETFAQLCDDRRSSVGRAERRGGQAFGITCVCLFAVSLVVCHLNFKVQLFDVVLIFNTCTVRTVALPIVDLSGGWRDGAGRRERCFDRAILLAHAAGGRRMPSALLRRSRLPRRIRATTCQPRRFLASPIRFFP